MKALSLILLLLYLFCPYALRAQSSNFQRLYGTNLNNSFTKTLRSGTSYYVLGRDEPTAGALNRATVTRLDAQGQHQWTLRLDIASQWNDAVVTPNGNLLLVGHTLPFDANCQSLAAVVTAAGAFSWVRSYNAPGRESFTRVARNLSPNNGAFPYYILGNQWDPDGNATWDDVVLLTMSEAGNFGWKKRYTGLFGTADDEFARDLEALPNGDLILAGNLGTNGVVFRADNTGSIYNATGPEGLSFSFADVTQTSGGFLAVGNSFPSVLAFLIKFDSDLLPQWQINLPNLTAISQVWRDGGNGIYVTGRATIASLNRGVVLKFQDRGNTPPLLLWMKYLDNKEVAYTGGSSWYLPPSQLAFNDGRNTSERAFMSVSDLDMNTCMTKEGVVSMMSADLLFSSPVPPGIEFVDVPMGTNVTLSSAVNWQQEDACPDPMDASIAGTKYRECGNLPYTNQPTVPDWTIQLLDGMGNVVATQQTDSAGRYGFHNLPKGNYIVREIAAPGWTPKVPATGEYVVNLEASQQVVRNFGNCPSCSCDDIYFDVVQLPGTSDTCEFGLAVTNDRAYCFDEINLVLSAGAFDKVIPADGWDVVVIDSQHVRLVARDDWTTFVFHKGRLKNAPISEMTVSASYNVGQGNVVCARSFGLSCPPPAVSRLCCPSGTMPGPELVQNGDFELGNQNFTNSYPYWPPGIQMPVGRYSVLNASQVYTANNQWACTDHTASSSSGRMLVVDGYGGPIAWQQTVPVTAGVKYAFSAWFNNLVRPPRNHSDPQVALWVDNTQIAGPLTLPETPDQWVLLCDTFYATVTGAVTLSIRMLSTANIGNDVAIDDVSFRRCVKCEPLPSDAIAWWPMDEAGGETNADEIVNYLTTVSLPGPIGSGGPNPVPGKVGGALEFASPGDRYLGISNDPKINFGNGSFTIDAWVKTDMPTQTAPIVDKLANQSNGYAFSIQGTPGLARPTLAIGTSGGVQVFQGPPINVGQWNFVAVTVNPPVVTFYVGGSPGGSGALATLTHTLSGTTSASNNLPLQIGRNPLNPHWQIIIDELELFGRALALTELDKIWAADHLGKCRKVCLPTCRVNTIDISTGANLLNVGTFLASGGTDPSWTLVATPPNAGLSNLPQPANLVGAYPGWATPPSRWISAFPFNNYGINNCPQGQPQNCNCPPFVFERAFCVCRRTEATFNFKFYADNNGIVELWREDPITNLPQFVTTLVDNCPQLNAVANFNLGLSVNTTLTLLPGRHMLRIKNWNISGRAVGANLHGTVAGLDLENDLCCLKPVGSLCVTKYHDLDCDSIRDINTANWTYIDPGLPNWAFQVTGVASSYTGMTNQQGQVCFTGLAPGTYTVTETLQQGWVPSSPVGGSTTVTVSAYNTTNVNFGNCTDSCACGPYEFLYSIGKGLLLSKNCGDVLFVPNNLPFQFLPSFSCSGKCTKPPTVDYVLTGPPGFVTLSANGVPITSLPITASTFTHAGTYTLTIVGDCDGKKCPCRLTFIFPGDCCKDYQLFLSNVQSFVSVTADNTNCKATLSIGNLPTCDYLEWINWGDGSPQQFGPFAAGSTLTHTYTSSGVYPICYLAIEKDPVTGLICFEKIVCDTLYLSCKDSWCPLNIAQNGDFSIGTPTPYDQDIWNASKWGGIWSTGSTGDFYNTTTAPPPSPPLSIPSPATQGNFGSCWILKSSHVDPHRWREGIMNELQNTIPANSGTYNLKFKLACLGNTHFGSPIINAYGVHAPGGLGSGTVIDDHNPPNLGLFPPGSMVLLGSYPIPATCDNTFQNINFSFNSNAFPPLGITHIFFTRDDNTNGGVYVAIDDVCLTRGSISTKETDNLLPLRLFPNPTPGTFTLELPAPATPGMSVHIASLTGQALLQQQAEPGNQWQVFDLSTLPAGLYFVQVWNEGKMMGIAKVVKQ